MSSPFPISAGCFRESNSSDSAVSPAWALGILGGLLLLCYYPVMLATLRFVVVSEDMAYGFFAPIVAFYVVWDKKGELIHPSGRPSMWGIVFFLCGGFLGVMASFAQSSTFSRMGLLFSLTGSLLVLGGWKLLRDFVFPLCILLFTFPVPDVLYAQITLPLQLLATRIAEGVFEVLGYSVLRDGNVLQLSHMSLNVIEACSGLRSLITLFFFCVVYTYFFETSFRVRLAVVLFAIPSAIAVNALRITGTGILGSYDMAWTVGTFHVALGWAAFLTGFLMVLLAHRLIAGAVGKRRPEATE